MGSGRIALFVPSLRGGGAERVMLTLAGGFADRGHEVDLVLVRAEGPYLSEVPEDVRIVDLRASRTLASLPALVRYLRRERPGAMLSAMDHANVVALWARRLAGAPERLAVTVRNTLSSTVNNSSSLRQRLVPLSVRLFYPWADAVVAVSHGVADDLARTTGLPRDGIDVIYNPAVTPDLISKAREPVDHPWFAADEPPVVLGVGRLTAQKDFGTLIRAFALVRRKRPARLVILGEGEDRPTLESLVRELELSDDVALPGFVENPFRCMARATVFVLSSRWEGLPNTLIQSMACGTPVIATDCPSGPAEILEGGRWGALVPVGDSHGLALAIEDMLQRGRVRHPGGSPVARFTLQKGVSLYLEAFRG